MTFIHIIINIIIIILINIIIIINIISKSAKCY